MQITVVHVRRERRRARRAIHALEPRRVLLRLRGAEPRRAALPPYWTWFIENPTDGRRT